MLEPDWKADYDEAPAWRPPGAKATAQPFAPQSSPKKGGSGASEFSAAGRSTSSRYSDVGAARSRPNASGGSYREYATAAANGAPRAKGATYEYVHGQARASRDKEEKVEFVKRLALFLVRNSDATSSPAPFWAISNGLDVASILLAGDLPGPVCHEQTSPTRRAKSPGGQASLARVQAGQHSDRRCQRRAPGPTASSLEPAAGASTGREAAAA